MKSFLTSSAFLAALAFPCVAFAEFLGLPLFSAADGGTLIGLFSILVLGLISVADYSRRTRLAVARRCCGARFHHRLAA